MIAKNEESTILKSLESTLPFIDEYIVGVDSLSTDNTKSKALGFALSAEKPVEVYDFVWEKDFSKARNEGLEKATCDYIFCLDGHETVVAGHEKIKQVSREPQGFEVFYIEIESVTAGKVTSFFQERLFLNSLRYRFHNECHNVIVSKEEVNAKLMDVKIKHERSEKLTTERKLQRAEMNIESLKKRIAEGDRRAKAQLPQEYFSTKEWALAVESLESYLEEEIVDRERYQVLIKLSMAHYWNKKIDSTINVLNNAGHFNVDKRNAHLVFLGELYYRLNNTTIAEAYFANAMNVVKPVDYWFLYPQFYHDVPKTYLEKIYDNYNVESNGQAPA